MRRKRRENMLQEASMINGAHGIENDEDDVRKEDEDMEESPLHSAISKFNDNSQFKEEEKYMLENKKAR